MASPSASRLIVAVPFLLRVTFWRLAVPVRDSLSVVVAFLTSALLLTATSGAVTVPSMTPSVLIVILLSLPVAVKLAPGPGALALSEMVILPADVTEPTSELPEIVMSPLAFRSSTTASSDTVIVPLVAVRSLPFALPETTILPSFEVTLFTTTSSERVISPFDVKSLTEDFLAEVGDDVV